MQLVNESARSSLSPEAGDLSGPLNCGLEGGLSTVSGTFSSEVVVSPAVRSDAPTRRKTEPKSTILLFSAQLRDTPT